jgi:hypothetical protein
MNIEANALTWDVGCVPRLWRWRIPVRSWGRLSGLSRIHTRNDIEYTKLIYLGPLNAGRGSKQQLRGDNPR